MNKNKTIIFDLDGTLFETKEGIVQCINEVLRSYNKDEIKKEEEDKHIGPSVKDSLMTFHNFNEKDALDATMLYRKIYLEKYYKNSVPYPGLVNTLNDLKNKEACLCIATLKSKPQLDKILELHNIQNYFTYIETASLNADYTKSQMLNSIKNKCSNSEIYFVGDTEGDYKASLNTEIPFIYATYGYGEIENYEGMKINCLEEIIKLIYK